MNTSILTLLTDFGTADYYVAAVKGTLLRLAPGTTLVDVSHEVPPGDVEAAAFLLAAAASSFPDDTVHLAVVDPGVGSARRMLAVRAASAFFVAPDNGLLTPFLDGAIAIRAVERAELFLPSPGQTFHGRDRFAPVAAWLLRGERFEDLGPEIGDPVRLPAPLPQRDTGRITGRVVHVDRYGNLITDIPAALAPPGPCRAEAGGHATERPGYPLCRDSSGRGGDAPRVTWHGRAVDERRRSGPALERGAGARSLTCAGTDLEQS